MVCTKTKVAMDPRLQGIIWEHLGRDWKYWEKTSACAGKSDTADPGVQEAVGQDYISHEALVCVRCI